MENSVTKLHLIEVLLMFAPVGVKDTAYKKLKTIVAFSGAPRQQHGAAGAALRTGWKWLSPPETPRSLD